MNEETKKLFLAFSFFALLWFISLLISISIKHRGGGIIIKYKGKDYAIGNWKEERKYKPLGEEDNKNAEEIIVKDYNVGFWNTTINVNGETIIVGWGPGKHLTVWGGSIILITVITLLTIRYLRIKENKQRDKSYQEWLRKRRA